MKQELNNVFLSFIWRRLCLPVSETPWCSGWDRMLWYWSHQDHDLHAVPTIPGLTLTSIMLEAILSKYHETNRIIEALQVNSKSEELIGEEWNTTKEHADTIQAALQVYLIEKASLSQSFDYWNTYVSNQFSVHWRLDSLPQCYREGNFTVILICENKQLSINLLFLQHYYQLKEKFPLLYGSYIHEWWICLEQVVECPCTRAVPQLTWVNNWGHQSSRSVGNLIKHKKTSVLKVKNDVQGELLLDHNFNPSTATTIVRMMLNIKEHLLRIYSPLQDQV